MKSPTSSTVEARRAGAAVVAGAGCVLVAYLFDAAPLFVPGLALLGLGLAGPLWTLAGVRGAHVCRLLDVDRIAEDEELTIRIEIRRGALARGAWGRYAIEDPVTGAWRELGVARRGQRGAGSRRTLTLRTGARFPRRGERHLPAPRLIVRDPLDLARARSAPVGDPVRVLVLPRAEPVRWASGARGRATGAGGGTDAAAEALAATDLEGLRPYRPGTPASRIHWPALARGRGLIERQLVADGDARPLLVLDARPALSGEDGPLDAAVRATASLALELARSGGCGVLLSGDPRPTALGPDLSGWPALVARLAVLGTEPARRVARPPALGGLRGRGGTLIYVAALPPERLLPALRSGRPGRVMLVVPETELAAVTVTGGSSLRTVPALTVSGCRGFALGARERERADARPGAAR